MCVSHESEGPPLNCKKTSYKKKERGICGKDLSKKLRIIKRRMHVKGNLFLGIYIYLINLQAYNFISSKQVSLKT